jgi:hypothetical protein
MTNASFGQSLYDEEFTTLGFKPAQYRLDRANDDEKSELHNHILG